MIVRDWLRGGTLAVALDNPLNSFNAVRLGAAALVVVSHSYYILGDGNASEPLAWSAYDLGALAVNMFFVLSGSMICRSLERNRDVSRYLRARLLRIYPGLIFAALVTALIIGPLGTTVSVEEYFEDQRLWLYPLTVAFDFAGASLPAFDHGLHETNASLWTIKFELLAYVGCLVLLAVGLMQDRRFWLAACLVSGTLVASGIGIDGYSADAYASLFRFSFAYSLGSLAYQYRRELTLNVPLALALAAVSVLLGKGMLGNVLGIVSFGYLALAVGAHQTPTGLKWTAVTDVSYGLYLFAWPIQQALMHWYAWTPALLPLHIGATFILTVPLAYLSWFAVEKPALRLK